MLYRQLAAEIVHATEEFDLLARITQHPKRPLPIRAVDQIFMLPGSQLSQLKLVAHHLKDKEVMFVGDGDCMALSIGLFAMKGVIDSPSHMHVLDFDERILRFVDETSEQFGFHDRIDSHRYNVRDTVPANLRNRGDVFYVNPPYGSKNEGFSGIAFIARGMELCKTVASSGVSILPYHPNREWSRSAMFNIQRFLVDNGYVVSEMFRGMHQYHLDDSPELYSGMLVADRVEEKMHPYAGRALTPGEMEYFYGGANAPVPDGIGVDGLIRDAT